MRWESIKGFEGLYEISDQGRVKSLGKGKSTNPNNCIARGLKLKTTTNGYINCKLLNKGKAHHLLVHRLVALHFIDNPDKKKEVNHKDGDKTNNCIENLEWVTSSENQKHAYLLGLQKIRSGANSPFSKPIEQRTTTGDLVKIWGSIKEACRELGFNSVGIIGCCKKKKKYKTAYGYKWNYVYKNNSNK